MNLFKKKWKLFGSVQDHTQKAVQMNVLACNLRDEMLSHIEKNTSANLTENVSLLKTFWMAQNVNNKRNIYLDGSEVCLKSVTFVHYTYVKSERALMVGDIKAKCIASVILKLSARDWRNIDDQTILFRSVCFYRRHFLCFVILNLSYDKC